MANVRHLTTSGRQARVPVRAMTNLALGERGAVARDPAYVQP